MSDVLLEAGLTGICCKQQEAGALLGRDTGTCSWFSLSFSSVPGIFRLRSVNHGRDDDTTRKETDCVPQFNPIFTNVWCPRRQENTFFNQVSVRHTSQELFGQDSTSLHCQVSLFPGAFICFHNTRGLNFNPKFTICLINETETAFFFCIHTWGVILLIAEAHISVLEVESFHWGSVT